MKLKNINLLKWGMCLTLTAPVTGTVLAQEETLELEEVYRDGPQA